MNLIVAVDNEWGIGYKGDLLAHIKNDLRNFAKLTTGKVVVLGSNTLSTFPGGRVLKNRTNIVLNWDVHYAPEGAIVVHSLEELFEKIRAFNTDDVYIIGGASVYRQMLPYCKRAYVTKFNKSFNKDVYIPDLDKDGNWEHIYQSEVYESEEGEIPLTYTFNTYENRQNTVYMK